MKNEGVLLFTIPVVYGRLSKRRDQLPDSFHGSQDEAQGVDFKVWTEYGADFWVEIFNAGFRDVQITSISDLSSIAITAVKSKKTRSKTYHFSVYINSVNRKFRKIIKRLLIKTT